MAACTKCGATETTVACETCGDPTCADCKAAPDLGNITAPAFATHCSDDCRDGLATLRELKMKECTRCNGKGETRYQDKCWSCGGRGKVAPETPRVPAAERGPMCPDCEGRYEFNTAMCNTCNGRGYLFPGQLTGADG